MTSIAKILSLNNLFLLDSVSLIDPAVLDRLEELSADVMLTLESGRAREFYDSLAELLKDNENQLRTNQEAYNRFSTIVWQVFWKAFPSLGDKEQRNVVAKNLVFSLRLGVNVKEYIAKIFGIYEFRIGPDKQMRRNFIYSLETNQETLGSQSIAMTVGQQDLPIVKNWLKLYNQSASLTSERGKFQQINFIKSNPNVGRLRPSEKEILEKIIELYDWLLFPPPSRIIVSDDDSGAISTFSNRPVAPTPKNQEQTTRVKMPEISAVPLKDNQPKPPVSSVLPSYHKPIPPPTLQKQEVTLLRPSSASNFAKATSDVPKASAGKQGFGGPSGSKNLELRGVQGAQENVQINVIEGGSQSAGSINTTNTTDRTDTTNRANMDIQNKIETKLHDLDDRIKKNKQQ